jgi:hypothetical protein
MSRPAVEVADILRAQGDAFVAQHPWLSAQQRSVLRAIVAAQVKPRKSGPTSMRAAV